MNRDETRVPLPDDFRLPDPPPPRGLVRKAFRWVVDRVLGWRYLHLRRSMEDSWYAYAVGVHAEMLRLKKRIEELEAAGVEQRLRRLERHRSIFVETSRLDPPTTVADDFVFGLRFRGNGMALRARAQSYLERFKPTGTVLDIGCGRGEWLIACREAEVRARGVDRDSSSVEACQEAGLDVVQGDAIQFLANQEPSSLSMLVAIHVLEHLPPSRLPSLMELALSRLVPGGHVVLELPNPTSCAGLIGFFVDPDHHKPLHPQVLSWILEQAGFVDIETEYLDPVPRASRCSLPSSVDDREYADAWARVAHSLDVLDQQIFGCMTYGMTARRKVTS